MAILRFWKKVSLEWRLPKLKLPERFNPVKWLSLSPVWYSLCHFKMAIALSIICFWHQYEWTRIHHIALNRWGALRPLTFLASNLPPVIFSVELELKYISYITILSQCTLVDIALPIHECHNQVLELKTIVLALTGSSAAQVAVIFQNDQIIVKPDLRGSRLRVIPQ